MKNILFFPPFRPGLVWRCKHSQSVLQNELFNHFQAYFSETFLDRRWFILENFYLTILGPNLYWNGYLNWRMFYLVECWLESRRACRFDLVESFSTSDLTDNRLDFGKTTPSSPQPCVIGEISVRANEYILTKIRNLAVFHFVSDWKVPGLFLFTYCRLE